MTTTLDFLEAMGRAPALPPRADFAAAIERLEIDDGQRRALLSRDAVALNRLLQGRPTMICMVMTPDADDPEQPDAVPERDPAETDDPEQEGATPDDAPPARKDI